MRTRGLEPPPLSGPGPKPGASADFATPASTRVYGLGAGGDHERLVGRANAAVIVLGALWTVHLLWSSYYFLDDFLALGDASRSRLDWSYLSSSVYGHFVPGWKLAFLVLERTSHFGYGPVIVATAAVQALTLWGLARLLTALVGRRWTVTIALAWYAISPALLETEMWWSNALHVMPSLCLTVFALDGFVRMLATGSRRYLWYSVPCSCSGLMFYEKPVLALLLLPTILVLVAVMRRGVLAGPAAALVVAARSWWVWPLYVVPMAAYFAYYLSHGYYGAGRQPPVGAFASAEAHAWFGGLEVALVGGPLRFTSGVGGAGIGHPSGLLEGLALIAFAGLVLATLVRRPRVAVVWVFAALAFAASFGVVAVGRLGGVARAWPTTTATPPTPWPGCCSPWWWPSPAYAPTASRHSAPRRSCRAAGMPWRTAVGAPRPRRGAPSPSDARPSPSDARPWSVLRSSGTPFSASRAPMPSGPSGTGACPGPTGATSNTALAALRASGRPFSLLDGPVPSTVSLETSYPGDLLSFNAGGARPWPELQRHLQAPLRRGHLHRRPRRRTDSSWCIDSRRGWGDPERSGNRTRRRSVQRSRRRRHRDEAVDAPRPRASASSK